MMKQVQLLLIGRRILYFVLALTTTTTTTIVTAAAAAAASTKSTPSTRTTITNNDIPHFTVEELLSPHSDPALWHAWTTTGLITVQLPESSSSSSSSSSLRTTTTEGNDKYDLRRSALFGLCDLVASSSSSSLFESFQLDDGITLRHSLATTTVGTTPLPLQFKTTNHDDDRLHQQQQAQQQQAQAAAAVLAELEDLRDQVAHISLVYQQAMDRVLRISSLDAGIIPAPLLSDSHGSVYGSMKDIVSNANHLEHFHVYTTTTTTTKTTTSTATTTTKSNRNENENSNSNNGTKRSGGRDTPSTRQTTSQQQQQQRSPNLNTTSRRLPPPPAAATAVALDWHTDAGLFLAFVPALNCNAVDTPDTSFWYKNSHDDIPIQATFPLDSVVFMIGAGAEHWLYTPHVPFQATRHALITVPTTTIPTTTDNDKAVYRRAWYGMMFLVPESAILQTVPTTRTFADMKKNMAWNQKKKKNAEGTTQDETETHFVSIGCGIEPDWEDEEEQLRQQDGSSMDHRHSRRRRRRLQHAVEPSACNNVTNFFCWMDCLDIPNHQQATGYITEGYSLYCLDPTILARTGNQVSKAMEPCDGQTHNSNCLGSWQPTVPGMEGAPIVLQVVDRNGTLLGGDDEEPYCYGGTSMYMDGFHWTHPICVIYLFPSWALTSRGKLTLAAIGTLAFGIGLEGVIWKRRTVLNSLTMTNAGPNQRLLVSATFYGAQLTMGYMLMLVIMTYSGVLFFCSIMGLVCGHAIFNAKDALWFRKNKNGNGNGNNQTKAKRNSQQPSAPSYQNSQVREEGVEAPLDIPYHNSTESSPKLSCCASGGEGEDDSKDDYDDEDIPEGSTPCCQH